MTHVVLAELTASVSELKKHPMATTLSGEGAPVATLNRNEPDFYCVPAKTFEAMLEQMDDLKLNRIADARLSDGQASVSASLDDL
ncbi:type II toxin-antitoxin system Phd/YefM family antitoxin [Acidithiobacillus sulfuriphilus]|uniref:type II toxin-antitoxin system Phd/YefM family antitoxin n=1 Tax=Acidithiobacillus sulfuriphilus TaxID=1867749 RepID=UPI003F5E6AC5